MNGQRTAKIALLSLLANFLYSIYTGAIGLIAHSWWFITLAAYYMVLSVMRFAVLLAYRNEEAGTGRSMARFTGGLFIALAVTLAGTTYLSLLTERGTPYHEIVMISIALYTFVKISFAVINLAHAGRLRSPVLKTLRSISFADAAVSIFSMQRSMLVTFEGMAAGDVRLLNALTGSAVYLLVFLLGINLIGGKRITMTKSKLTEANEKIAAAVTGGYKKLESGVVAGYKKIETGVVQGYSKLEDKFVDQFLTREGETVEEAKQRLKKGP